MSGPQGRSAGAGFTERLEAVRGRIRSASADPGAVRIVAVTKGFGADAVVSALAAGIADVGENYADELVAKAGAVVAKAGAVAETGAVAAEAGEAAKAGAAVEAGAAAVEAGAAADGARGGRVRADGQPVPVWHFLGAVQRNKVPRLAPWVAWWQTVSRVEEGRAIAGRHPGATVLVQVDVAGLPGRGGCPPDQVHELVAALRDQDLDVAGLMAVGPPGVPEASRPGFALVSGLADRLDLPVRSMGMSDDLEVAVAEGSTMVRLGRALFGERPLPEGRR